MLTVIVAFALIGITFWMLIGPLLGSGARLAPIVEVAAGDQADREITTYQDLKDLELDYTMGKVEQKEYERLRNALEDEAIQAMAGREESLVIEEAPEDSSEGHADVEDLIRQRRAHWREARGSVLLALLVAFALPSAASAQGTPPPGLTTPDGPAVGRVEVAVTNGTDGAPSPSGLDVKLEGLRNGNVDEALSKDGKLDKSGRAQFEGLTVGPGISYRLTTTYEEAEYSTDPVAPTATDPQAELAMMVWEATEDTTGVRISYDHTIVEPTEGGVRVHELLIMENDTDRTYVGPYVDEIGQRAVVRVNIPEDAGQFGLSEGLMECCVQFLQHTLTERMPLFPGRRQIQLSYVVPATKGQVALPRTPYYNVVQSEVFLPEGYGVTTTPNLALASQFGSETGRDFQRVSGSDLKGGEPASITIAGIASAGGLPLPAPALAALFGLVLLAGLVMLVRRRAAAPVTAGAGPAVPGGPLTDTLRTPSEVAYRRPTADVDRDLLIERIAWLDEMFESGAVAEEFYRHERKALLDLIEH